MRLKLIQNHILISLITIGLVVWIFNLKTHTDYLSISSDAATYADIARNIVTGRGISSNLTLPLYTSYIKFTAFNNWPPYYPPLHPIAIAISFLLFKISDLAIVITSGFFYIATIPILFVLAKRLIDEKVAALASLWYIFSPALATYAISGMTESLFTFLVTFIALLTLKKSPKLFLAGIVSGLAFLTKFQGILLVPPLIFYILFKYSKNKFRSVSTVLAGFLLIFVISKMLLPPLAQDFESFQNLEIWRTLAFESFIPKDQFTRIIAPTTPQMIVANLDLIAKKILSNSYLFVQRTFNNPQSPIVVLFLLSFLIKTNNRWPKIAGFRFLTLTFLAFLLLFHALTIFDMRYLYPFIPLLVIFSSQTLISLIETLNKQKAVILTSVFVFLLILVPFLTSPGFATSAKRSYLKNRKPTIAYILGQIAKENTPANSIIASDNFTYLAWYGQRRAILLPATIEELETIDSQNFPIDAVLLYTHPHKPPLEPYWQELIDSPHGFGKYVQFKEFYFTAEENYSQFPLKIVLYSK